MHFSLLSKLNSNNPGPIVSIVTWIFRIIVGCVFIISGFVKAIDPWGSLYKFEEYIAALGVPMLHTLLLTGVFGLCALEFLIGIFTIAGCYRKSCPVVALIFMCIMLPLTLWIAICNPVSDCGCFGDYIILSNWATFWKNVIIILMVIWLVKFNRFCTAIISPAFQWMAFVISLVFIITISIHGYIDQPFLDFRPYKAGKEIVNISESDSDENEDFRFVYEKDGIRKEFGVDDELPSEEEGWKFVERIDILPDKNANTHTDTNLTFRLWDISGENDLTEDIMEKDNSMLLLLIPDLPSVSPATTWKINELYDWSSKNDMEMIAVVSGSTDQINTWRDISMPQYDIYTCDDTAIKEVARGNPAIVYVRDNKIVWKTTLGALDVEKLTEQDKTGDLSDFIKNGKHELLNLIYLFLICMAVPVTLSLLPRIKDAYTIRQIKKAGVNHDDMARREE